MTTFSNVLSLVPLKGYMLAYISVKLPYYAVFLVSLLIFQKQVHSIVHNKCQFPMSSVRQEFILHYFLSRW